MRKKRQTFQSNPKLRDPRRRIRIIGIGVAGFVLGSGIGYVFGRFAMPLMLGERVRLDFGEQGYGFMCLWLGALIGAFAGARVGDGMYKTLMRREYQERRRARYADQIARYEQDKAAQAEKEDPWENWDGGDGRGTSSAERAPVSKTTRKPRRKKQQEFESPWP